MNTKNPMILGRLPMASTAIAAALPAMADIKAPYSVDINFCLRAVPRSPVR
jgi:hypothetical protein